MSTLLQTPQNTDQAEQRLELNAVLILQSGLTRTELIEGAEPLRVYAHALTNMATRWRKQLSAERTLQYARLTNAPAAIRAFEAWVPAKSKSDQGMQIVEEHPECRDVLITLFQVDALKSKWDLLHQGVDLFTGPHTKEAVMLYAQAKAVKGLVYEAVGHVAKELAKNGLALHEATPELVVALLERKLEGLLELGPLQESEGRKLAIMRALETRLPDED